MMSEEELATFFSVNMFTCKFPFHKTSAEPSHMTQL